MRDQRSPRSHPGSLAFPMFIAAFVALIATLVVIGYRDTPGGRDPSRTRNMGPLLDVAPTDGPTVVASGNADPACFVPWSETTRLFRYEPRPAPYRVALVNGYVGNDWRRQMIRTAKAYAARPEVASRLREFKVVSTGEDVAAQLRTVEAFIDSGFDAILLDAPCTATGTIRRHPEILHLRRPRDVAAMAETQARLLEAAAAMLKPGGRLVYAVCSLQPEEGAERVQAALDALPLVADPFAPGECPLPDALMLDGTVRTTPAMAPGMDGFFIARMRRS